MATLGFQGMFCQRRMAALVLNGVNTRVLLGKIVCNAQKAHIHTLEVKVTIWGQM